MTGSSRRSPTARAASEKIQSSFVGIDKADIVGAEMKGGEAHVTLRIVSELISATRNKAGEVIDGDPETVAEVKDVWTFARDTRSRDPNWKLVATEAGRLTAATCRQVSPCQLLCRDRLSPALPARRFGDLPGWARRPRLAFAAFRRSARACADRNPIAAGSLGVAAQPSRAPIAGGAATARWPIGAAARAVLRGRFRPARIAGSARGSGFVTGFYEPEVDASRSRRGALRRAAAARPADLVDIDDANRPPAWTRTSPSAGGRGAASSNISTGRRSSAARWRARAGDRLACRPGRRLLHPRAGRGPAQDAGRHEMRVTYAAKTGQRYTGPGADPRRARRDPAGRGDDAVDPRLVRAQSASASTRSCGRTAPTSSSARRRWTSRRSGPSPPPRCR